MTNMKLYHMPASRSLRVAWLIEELGLDCDIEKMAHQPGNMGGESFKSVHPMQKVPVLVDKGQTLYESIAIMQYIIDKYGNNHQIIPSLDSPEYGLYLQWLHFGESTLSATIVNLMLQNFFFPKEQKSQIVVDYACEQLAKQYKLVDDALGSKEYILEHGFSPADISLSYNFLLTRLAGAKHLIPSNLEEYWQRLKKRPGFQRARDY